MTPNVRDVLQGVAVALATPPSPEVGWTTRPAASAWSSTLAMLAAGEAGPRRRATPSPRTPECARCSPKPAPMTRAARSPLRRARPITDLSVPALDAANARLRRLLIGLHEKVEAANDAGLNRQIVALYVRMAQIRRMALGGG